MSRDDVLPVFRGLLTLLRLRLYLQGYNSDCQLGDGTKTSRSKPTRAITVPDEYSITSISSGYKHTCVVTGDDAVLCFGDNRSERARCGVIAAR